MNRSRLSGRRLGAGEANRDGRPYPYVSEPTRDIRPYPYASEPGGRDSAVRRDDGTGSRKAPFGTRRVVGALSGRPDGAFGHSA
ncbi:hypothetical protein AB0F25_06480 [Streptomyces wedmorensis]|uniref:hypothetical protein n=1 Tax=Streptomyces wedmorensis TaxID=43759 RepID=UPI0034379B01